MHMGNQQARSPVNLMVSQSQCLFKSAVRGLHRKDQDCGFGSVEQALEVVGGSHVAGECQEFTLHCGESQFFHIASEAPGPLPTESRMSKKLCMLHFFSQYLPLSPEEDLKTGPIQNLDGGSHLLWVRLRQVQWVCQQSQQEC
ncbi:hypothetical protein CB1_001226010 [Camelus ferus]|nr:hypothetical protein CB1_001226010 [Camelus ferus]